MCQTTAVPPKMAVCFSGGLLLVSVSTNHLFGGTLQKSNISPVPRRPLPKIAVRLLASLYTNIFLGISQFRRSLAPNPPSPRNLGAARHSARGDAGAAGAHVHRHAALGAIAAPAAAPLRPGRSGEAGAVSGVSGFHGVCL